MEYNYYKICFFTCEIQLSQRVLYFFFSLMFNFIFAAIFHKPLSLSTNLANGLKPSEKKSIVQQFNFMAMSQSTLAIPETFDPGLNPTHYSAGP